MANSQTSSVFTTQPTCTTVYTTSDTVSMHPATSCSGAVAANYWFTYTSGQVTIQPAVITVTNTQPGTSPRAEPSSARNRNQFIFLSF